MPRQSSGDAELHARRVPTHVPSTGPSRSGRRATQSSKSLRLQSKVLRRRSRRLIRASERMRGTSRRGRDRVTQQLKWEGQESTCASEATLARGYDKFGVRHGPISKILQNVAVALRASGWLRDA